MRDSNYQCCLLILEWQVNDPAKPHSGYPRHTGNDVQTKAIEGSFNTSLFLLLYSDSAARMACPHLLCLQTP